MSAWHVEDITGFIGLKWHEMSCLHDMSVTCHSTLVGLIAVQQVGDSTQRLMPSFKPFAHNLSKHSFFMFFMAILREWKLSFPSVGLNWNEFIPNCEWWGKWVNLNIFFFAVTNYPFTLFIWWANGVPYLWRRLPMDCLVSDNTFLCHSRNQKKFHCSDNTFLHCVEKILPSTKKS